MHLVKHYVDCQENDSKTLGHVWKWESMVGTATSNNGPSFSDHSPFTVKLIEYKKFAMINCVSVIKASLLGTALKAHSSWQSIRNYIFYLAIKSGR